MESIFEPFVEADTTTAEDREREARYWDHLQAIEDAADAHVAERDRERQEETCPECGGVLEWEDSDSEIGRAGLWFCPACEE